jgi:hypothetical protein
VTPDQLDDAAIAEWAARSRAASGVPPTVEDPVVLARLITLALGPRTDEEEGGGGRAPA